MGLFGGAGHSFEIAKKLDNTGMLIGIDRDEEALSAARNKLADYSNIKYIHGNHDEIKKILKNLQIDGVDGILLDLGVSSYQIDNGKRGFSYISDGPLDMRMDKTSEITAKYIINTYKEETLSEIISKYGEEKFAKKIAHSICEKRKNKEIETTKELAEIIKSAIPVRFQNEGHPAKRTFQAIRIEVNNELGVLEKVLPEAIEMLKPGARICVITFHSLEDRIVKQVFKKYSELDDLVKGLPVIPDKYKPMLKLVNKKVILPTEEELDKNSRSRSAKLRIGERI